MPIDALLMDCCQYFEGKQSLPPIRSIKALSRLRSATNKQFISVDSLSLFYSTTLKNRKVKKLKDPYLFALFVKTVDGMTVTLLPKKDEADLSPETKARLGTHRIDGSFLFPEKIAEDLVTIITHRESLELREKLIHGCMAVDWLVFDENYTWWTYDDYRDLFDNPKFTVKIALHGDTVVGYIAFYKKEDGSFWCHSLSRHPQWMGYHIGEKLLQELMTTALDLGQVKVGLRVLRDNAPAISLYQRFGFQIIQEVVDEDARGAYIMSQTCKP